MSNIAKEIFRITNDTKLNVIKTTKLELIKELELEKDLECRLNSYQIFKDNLDKFETQNDKEFLLITYLKIGQLCIIDHPYNTVEYLAKALKLAIELNRFDEAGNALWFIAKAQILLCNFRKAISCYIRYLCMSKKISQPIAKWRIFWRITEANLAIGNIHDAIKYEKLYTQCDKITPQPNVNQISDTNSNYREEITYLFNNKSYENLKSESIRKNSDFSHGDELDDLLDYIVSDISKNQNSGFELLLKDYQKSNQDVNNFNCIEISPDANHYVRYFDNIRNYLEEFEDKLKEEGQETSSNLPVLPASYVEDFFLKDVPAEPIKFMESKSSIQKPLEISINTEYVSNTSEEEAINLVNKSSNNDKKIFTNKRILNKVNDLDRNIDISHAELYKDMAISNRDIGRLCVAIPQFDKLLNLGRKLKNIEYQITALFYLQDIYRKFACECVEKNGGYFTEEASQHMKTVLSLCKDRIILNASYKMSLVDTEVSLQEYEKSGRHLDALALFPIALQKSLKDGDKFRELNNRLDVGTVYFTFHRFLEAQNEFEQALNLVSRFPNTDMEIDIIYKLYETNYILKDFKSALFYSQKYLKLIYMSPNFDKVHKAYQTIMNLCMETKDYGLGSIYTAQYSLFCEQVRQIYSMQYKALKLESIDKKSCYRFARS